MVINSDIDKRLLSRVLWIVIVTLRVVRSFFLSIGRSRPFHRENQMVDDKFYFDAKYSPSRNFSEYELTKVDWRTLLSEYNKLKIVDFGSGDARYYQFFSSIMKEDDFEYYAVEQPGYSFPKWFDYKSNLFHEHCDLNHNIPSCVRVANVFISMSVLEHLDKGVDFITRYENESPVDAKIYLNSSKLRLT